MSSLQDILDACRATAIANAITSNDVSNWRYICREYSRTFNTPLHIVLEMDPESVAMAFFENQLDGRDVDSELENLLDSIYELEDPNYTSEKREDLKKFMLDAEAEEEARVASNKPIHPGIASEEEVTLKSTSKKTPEFKEPKPTGGSINLSYLAGQDGEE